MVEAVITVDDRDVIAHLDRLPKDLHDRLVSRLGPIASRMQALVQAGEPSRTGRLRGQTRGAVADGPTFVRAQVTIVGLFQQDFAKAGALEYGVPGASPRSASRAPGGFVSVHSYHRKRGESVQAYRRRVRIEARRFLRQAAAAMQAQGMTAIQAAIDETVAE